MNRLAKLQLLGPLVLLAGLLAAEGASRALAHAPSSPMVWYTSRELFGLFRNIHFFLLADFDIVHWQLLLVGLPLFSMACCGLFFGRRLILAVASNLSLVYVLFLLCCDCWPPIEQSALATIRIPTCAEFLVACVLFGSSLLSFVISHVAYLRAIRDETSWPTMFRLPISSWWSLPRSCSMSR